jgi:hypothetical protein
MKDPRAQRRRTLEQRRAAAARAEAVDLKWVQSSKMRRGPYEDKMARPGPAEDLLEGVEFSNHIAEDLARDQGLTRFDFSVREPSGKRGFTKPDVEEILGAVEARA